MLNEFKFYTNIVEFLLWHVECYLNDVIMSMMKEKKKYQFYDVINIAEFEYSLYN